MKRYMSPGRFIALGFFLIIMLGAFLFLLPISQKVPGSISFTDALFTSTSAVCVTGLSTFDPGTVLSPFGQTILALLIQFGGLGFVCISVGFIMFSGQKLFIRQRTLVKEALNYGSLDNITSLVKSVLFITLITESIGALLNFALFSKTLPLSKAIGVSLFHAVSSFNNAGFDIFGNGNNLISYSDNTALLLITSFLIIFGGIGYLVIKEIIFKHKFKKFTLHTKVVLTMTISLLILGTLLFKITENYSWLDAFFMSVSTRTAGFTTVDLGNLSNAGYILYCLFMFIGASPTSTGGGIKTTTFLIVIISLCSYFSANKPCLFKRTLAKDILYKAFIIFTMGLTVIFISLFLLCLSQNDIAFNDLLFEVFSAFGTVGLSTGITSSLSSVGKYIIIVTMFIGRLGPLTIASLWMYKKTSHISYAEESVTLG